MVGILMRMDQDRRAEGYVEPRSLSNDTYVVSDGTSEAGKLFTLGPTNEPVLSPDFPSDWILARRDPRDQSMSFFERAPKPVEDIARKKLRAGGLQVEDSAIFTRKIMGKEMSTKLTPSSKVFDVEEFQRVAAMPRSSGEDLAILLARSIVSASEVQRVVAKFH